MSQVALSISPDSASTDATDEDTASQSQVDALSLQGVFDLLRSLKHVQRILKVEVKDNPRRNCSDQTIEACLKGFDVRYLNWDKYDLCSDVVVAVAKNVIELWLYSSGNNAVLRSWSGEEGLGRLKQVITSITHLYSLNHLSPILILRFLLLKLKMVHLKAEKVGNI